MKSLTLDEAVENIAKHELLCTRTEHYLAKYDVQLHVILGTELYSGAYLCARKAKELKLKRRR